MTKPATIIKRYIREALNQFDMQHEVTEGYFPRLPNDDYWRTSIWIEASTYRYDVKVLLIGSKKYGPAQAIVLHPELGHWLANLNGAAERNIGTPNCRRTIDQMKHDVEVGFSTILWPELGF